MDRRKSEAPKEMWRTYKHDRIVYDVRGPKGKFYNMGGWFGPNWFPCGKWWGASE